MMEVVAMMLMTVMLMLMMFHANADDDTDGHDGNSENNDDDNDDKGKEKKKLLPPNEHNNCRKCHAGAAAPVPHMRMRNGNLIFCTIGQCEYSGSCVRHVATRHTQRAPTFSPNARSVSLKPPQRAKDPSTTDLFLTT